MPYQISLPRHINLHAVPDPQEVMQEGQDIFYRPPMIWYAGCAGDHPRFLDTKLMVHPEVVRYILENNEPDLIERIIASVPKDAIVVSAKHIPGIRPTRDGTRFLVDPEVEVVAGSAGTSER